MLNSSKHLAAVFAAALGGSAAAQHLYSHAGSESGATQTIALKLVGAQANTTFTVAVNAAALLTVSAPPSITSDARGYAVGVLAVRAAQANTPPLAFDVRIVHPSLPNGMLQRDYLVKAASGRLESAWPEYMMILGVFCNPVNSASTHLQIDRTVDLDGDGYYGDVNVEANASGSDPLDWPSEFSTDVNATGTSGCRGGSPPGLFLPGASNRQVAFCADNRVVNGPCSFTSVMNFLEDMDFAPSLNGAPALLVTGSGADQVLICRDANGDGSIVASEIGTFFDPITLVNNENYSSDGLALDPSSPGRVYWISDKSGATGSPTNQGLFRMADANGDDSIGAGEWQACWTGTTGAVVVEGQTIDHTEFECVHVDTLGGVLVNQTALGTIFRWMDGNGNGIAETGEVTNWLTYNTGSTLTVSADFQQPTFPVIAGPYFGMNLIEGAPFVGLANRDVFYFSTTSSGIGHVFRGEDRNLDGDVNDAGEVTIFADPAMSTDPFPADWLTGLDVALVDLNGDTAFSADEVFVYGATPRGPQPSCGYTGFADLSVWRFHDSNGNGNANDPGESQRVSIHPTGAFNRGLEVVPAASAGGFRHTFYSRSHLLTVRAPGCTPPSGEYLELDFARSKEEEGTEGTPFAGNQRFALISRGNGSGGLANAGILIGGGLLPTGFVFGSCPLWLAPPLFANLIPPTVPDVSGVARFAVPIPNGVRGRLYLQPFSLQGTQVYLGEVGELRVQ